MIKNLASRLQKLVNCYVSDEKQILKFYSVDSSFYKKNPKVVVFPKHASQISKIIKFASRENIPIVARGGSTGLVGSALTNGIILDMKHFNRIRVFNNHIAVGSGVSKGQTDQVLLKHRKFLGPNPSVGPYCTIGGMISTNASGTKSLKYGSVIDNLLSIRIIDGQGRLIDLPSNSNISRKINSLLDENIVFPDVTKNSCGYRLDKIKDGESHKIIAGSESTLGIILEAKLKIYDIPRKRELFVIGVDSLESASELVPYILPLNPAALELIDDSIMKFIPFNFDKRIHCLLLVEFDSMVSKSTKKLQSIIPKSWIIYETVKADHIARWWAYRDAALYYTLKNIPKNHLIPHIIEDATIPVQNLQFLIPILRKLVKEYKSRFVTYGHIGNGNIHIRLISSNHIHVNNLAKEFFSFVIAMGGSISGEHGDGIARTKYVKMQYSKDVYSKFIRLKQIFDPKSILNPKNIIS